MSSWGLESSRSVHGDERGMLRIIMPSTSCDNVLALDFMNYASYLSIYVSYMQKSREVKMDDI